MTAANKDILFGPDMGANHHGKNSKLPGEASARDNVSGQSYDYVVRLLLAHGKYPLRLGECDLPDVM
jgi:hypothetical protein